MRTAVLLTMVLLAGPAAAQDAAPSLPANLAGFAGPWSLETADASLHCVVMLLPDAGVKGYALNIADSCAKLQPLAAVAGWSLDGSGAMVFSDAAGKPVLQLAPQGGGGTFASPADASPRYVLVALSQPEGDE